jgi:DNA-binding beta-propeller fold protein YncE
MRRTTTLALFAVLTALCPAGAAPQAPLLVPEGSYELARLLGSPLPANVLKLFRAVADPVRNRVYVAGIMTPDIAVMDGATERWITTVPTGVRGFAVKYLALDPSAQLLYVLDASSHTLRSIDLVTGAIAGPVDVPRSMGGMAVDPGRTLLYFVTPEAPWFRAVDGRTLATVYTSSAMGAGVNQVIYDERRDVLWALDGAQPGPQGRLYRFDPASRTVAATVRYPLPSGARASKLAYDADGQRLVAAVPGRFLSVLSTSGSELARVTLPSGRELEDVLWDGATGRILALSVEAPRDGEVAGRTGHLVAYDPSTGQAVSDVSFGQKVHSLALNPATSRVYAPNADASIVWSVEPDRKTVKGLRLGDSIEQVLLARGGRLLVTPSRLGGSYLAAWDVEARTLETFTAGTWPIPVRTFNNGEWLVVLDAWDSTLSVFSLAPPRTLLARIPLGLPRGSTDRLPGLAIDQRRGRAFASYAEFGGIAVVDGATVAPAGFIPIEGFPAGDEGGGPGDLQVVVDEEAGRLLAYWGAQKRVTAFDATPPFAKVAESKVPAELAATSLPLDALFLDAGRRVVFAGPAELDSATGTPTGRKLPRGDRVFALDEARGLLWATGTEGKGNATEEVVVALDRATLAEVASASVGASESVTPQLALDPGRGLLYVGWMAAARLDAYFVTMPR